MRIDFTKIAQYFGITCAVAGFLFATSAQAQDMLLYEEESAPQQQETFVVAARVIAAEDPVYEEDLGFGVETFTQEVRLRLTHVDGTRENVDMLNDFAPLSIGDRIYVHEMRDAYGVYYSVYDIDRRQPLLILAALFVVVIVAFGGRAGLRSLVALVVSVLMILYVLMPAVVSEHSPLGWGVAIAIVLLALVMGLTHGLRPKTYAAFLGTSIAVLITGSLAYIVTHMAAFSGIGSEEAFFLSVASQSIDMTSLLLTGIIIGMLGVLDDVAITQAAVVMELKKAGVKGAKNLYSRAMVVGREHVGALINTLVLAYAGASLPLFLLLATYEEPFGALVSIELVAVEIVRALVGSIGLVLAVPLTTFLATRFNARDEQDTHAACAHGH